MKCLYLKLLTAYNATYQLLNFMLMVACHPPSLKLVNSSFTNREQRVKYIKIFALAFGQKFLFGVPQWSFLGPTRYNFLLYEHFSK